ncbi:hypothetical protein S7711_04142 [Stachybotrys chartarum IBT 7711]|uniref:lytic cellulose monooxygenase (C4-dehydrogenating) n=1 Tax=Stachybotrys chartarum (strain CBS 109288 / IBT 7711) TaxID=1280523 RepID=A0A084B6J7_STACB|nr:hypothetical protein S7711_04142 [Stachybotrys chartarum IBT 7711]KFA71210.1 hypothetical protein S40288_03844 [Stachybotrys chartarum IBT 40288]
MGSIKALVSALLLATGVKAHGHVRTVIADGVSYPGGIPHGAPSNAVGWRAQNQDNGFVAPNAFSSQDIICHRGASPASASATVRAGGTVTLQWDTWPESHHGPVIDYIASCGGSCANVNKASLSWVKIAQRGLISGSNPGRWASDELISRGNSWSVAIPSNLAPGGYVLRHEIIALHSAGQQNGAQAYPQCINLQVTGSGGTTPRGVSGTSLYRSNDPGILFNLYTSFSNYPIPGPALSR